jgi:hypothetical protein
MVLNFLHSPVKNRSGWRTRDKAGQKSHAHKKARQKAGCEVQGNLEVLEKLTVVGRFAV